MRTTLGGHARLMLSLTTLAANTATIPPVRAIGATTAEAIDSLGSVMQVVELGDGHVLVNDGVRKRLLLLDAHLRSPVRVMDNEGSATRAYGGEIGSLGRYAGDTCVFLDVQGDAFVVIAPNGSIVRIMALPPGMTGYRFFGVPLNFDPRGRLVYAAQSMYRCSATPQKASTAIMRFDAAKRSVDTIGATEYDACDAGQQTHSADGLTITTTQTLRPFGLVDDWAVVADGSVAFVRAQSYSVEWVAMDGTHHTAQKIEHEWRRLDSAAKAAVRDSLLAYLTAQPSPPPTVNNGVTRLTVHEVAPIEDIPDYRPAFYAGVVADAMGNLWIPSGDRTVVPGPSPSTQFDVVDGNGTLIDRVRIPGATRIVGFGPNTVYLSAREGNGATLVAAKIR